MPEPADKSEPADVRKILFLSADPSDQARLRLDREYRNIKESHERSRLRDKFVLNPNLATRPKDLRTALLDERPAIVHFSGHGSGSGGLILEDDAGAAQLAPTNALADLFKLFSEQTQCVVLNSCLSLAQAEEIVMHVPYVIGMSQEIGDKAAIDFSCGFYDALFAGQPFEQAFKIGCNAIEFESQPTNVTEGVTGRNFVNPNVRVVATLAEYLKPVLLVRPDIFIHCHANNDAAVEGELLKSLRRAGLRVGGDWEYRSAAPPLPAHVRKALLRASRQIFMLWTPDWRTDAAKIAPEVEPTDRRVRVLLWDELAPPNGFTGAAVCPFHPADQRGGILTRLLTDLGLLAPVSPTVVQNALNTFVVLRDLMQTDAVRLAVGLAFNTLTRARDNIGELNRWKQLHDLLHALTVPFPLLGERVEAIKKIVTVPNDGESPEDQQRALDGAWRKAREFVNQSVLPLLRVLVAHVSPPRFQPAEVPWIMTLQLAQGKLDTGCKEKDLRALRRGVELLSPVLGQWMASVDQLLFVTANGVPLETLVQELEKIGQTVDRQTFVDDAVGRVEEFKRGIFAIRQLHLQLQTLITTHTCLQTIDSLTNQLDSADVTAEEIDAVWQGVLPTMVLIGAGAGDDWLAELGRQRAEVDQAIPPALGEDPKLKELSRLRDAFSDFRSQLVSGFLLADQRLKKFCEDLQALRESLGNAIEGLQR